MTGYVVKTLVKEFISARVNTCTERNSTEANYFLPTYVIEHLKKIDEKNAQKGNSQSLHPTPR